MMNEIPLDLVLKAARHWFGNEATIEHDQEKTVRSMDGGSYTLRGVRLSSHGESAMLYLDSSNIPCIEFYDGSAGRLILNEAGQYEYRGLGDLQIIG